MKQFVQTKFFGLMSIKDAEWLNKKLKEAGWNQTIDEIEGVPSELVIGTTGKQGTKYLRPLPLWYQYIGMTRAKQAIWMDVCSKTSNAVEREALMFRRWQGTI